MPSYQPTRHSRSEFVPVRGLDYHVRIWEPVAGQPCAGTLVMLHGWMDVSASFQFLVDAFERNWRVIAPDWRGFGLTSRAGADSYWFPDYLADLEFLLDALLPDEPVDLVAHSMGGNIAMIYAGVRPQRIRRLVNLEGMGMQATQPDQAPERYGRWIDEIRHGTRLRDYASRAEVAARLIENNPRLSAERAGFLAEHWAQPTEGGRYILAGDPAHKIVNAQLYRVDEVLACWRQIRADMLLVVARQSDRWYKFLSSDEFRLRLLAVASLRTTIVDDAGHMLHHDQPREVARLIEEFLG